MLLYLATLAFLSRYDITRKRHGEIVGALALRRAERSAGTVSRH
jgi:Na+/melibiose symporter-like transporter